MSSKRIFTFDRRVRSVGSSVVMLAAILAVNGRGVGGVV